MNFKMHSFARYWLRSEFKRRHIWILGLLVTLGISGLTFVDLFSQRLSQTASRDTRKFLSADYRISSWESFPEDFSSKLEELVPAADTMSGKFLIASFKDQQNKVSAISLAALENPYPFYGDWKTTSDLKMANLSESEVFIDESARSKGFKTGDLLKIGKIDFKIKDFVELEPQALSLFRPGQFKVWMRLQDFETTALDGPGSRINNRIFVKAPEWKSSEFRERFREIFPSPNIQLRSADQSNAQAQQTVSVLRSYLAFVSLCATLLGIVGLFFMFVSDLQKRLPTHLTLRCLGLSDRALIEATVAPVLVSALIGAFAGFTLGAWAESILSAFAATQLKLELSAPSSYTKTFILAIFTSLLALAPVIYFPIKALLKTPTQVLFSGTHSSNNLSQSFNNKAIGTCLLFTFLLSLITTQSLKLSVFGFLGVSIGLLLLGFILWVFIKALARFTQNSQLKGFTFPYLIQSFTQKTSQTFVWVLSLSFSLFFLSLGTILASSIHQQISKARVGNAPNLLTLGLNASDYEEHASNFPPQTEWISYVQSRLFEIDGSPIEEINKKQSADIDEEGGGPQIREYFVNVRKENELFDGETIAEGTSLFGAPIKNDESIHASLESDFAERMGLNEIGKTFTLEIAGVKLGAVVSSLRKVQWFQFRPNFFIVLNFHELEGAPLSYTALSTVSPGDIPQYQEKIISLVSHASPMDLTQTAEQVETMLDKLLLTVKSSSVFLFLAALMVIAAVTWAKRGEKTSEFALLKCLGLGRRALIGQLFGEILIGVSFAWILTWTLVLPAAQIISRQFFNSDMAFPNADEAIFFVGVISISCIFLYMILNFSLSQKSARELFQENEI